MTSAKESSPDLSMSGGSPARAGPTNGSPSCEDTAKDFNENPPAIRKSENTAMQKIVISLASSLLGAFAAFLASSSLGLFKTHIDEMQVVEVANYLLRDRASQDLLVTILSKQEKLRGEQGPEGPTGPTGSIGPQGPEGKSAVVNGYLVVPTMSEKEPPPRDCDINRAGRVVLVSYSGGANARLFVCAEGAAGWSEIK